MKTLIDSCVWSLSLRRKKPSSLSEEELLLLTSLTDAIRNGRVAILGPIRQEVLSGIKEPAQFERLRNALAAFTDEPITTAHYEEAARLFNLCRSRGVECGPVDILICAVAESKRWKILTNDGGLKKCMNVIASEKHIR